MKGKVTYNANEAKIMLRGLGRRAGNMQPAMRSAHAYIAGKTADTFRKLAHGGTHRGVTWLPYADQYTRKDGTTIPSWGGVKRVRRYRDAAGKLRRGGNVKARLRPSGQRITKRSNLLQDTGRMRAEATQNYTTTAKSMTIRVQRGYASKQQAKRPFLFIQHPKDTQYFANLVGRWITHGERR